MSKMVKTPEQKKITESVCLSFSYLCMCVCVRNRNAYNKIQKILLY